MTPRLRGLRRCSFRLGDGRRRRCWSWQSPRRRFGPRSPNRPEWPSPAWCFRLILLRTDAARFDWVVAIAAAAGHGLGWRQLDADAPRPAADIRLTGERLLLGRLLGPDGRPAAGVEVLASWVSV
jgi:hypothetical protein